MTDTTKKNQLPISWGSWLRTTGMVTMLVFGLIMLGGCPTQISDQAAEELQAADTTTSGDDTAALDQTSNGDDGTVDETSKEGQSSGPSVQQQTPKIGDLNGDGIIDAADVDAFTKALADLDGYAAAYPNGDPAMGDCNGDGILTMFDIECFASMLEAE